MFQMMKQAAQMQMELKRVQKQLAKQTVVFENAGVHVTARCDMSIEKVEVTPGVLEGANAEKLGRQITAAVNGAMAAAKKQAGAEMSKLAGAGGMGGLRDLLGG
jgi:DNA-binding protein YbaB